MLIPEFYDQWADRMEDYLNGIDEKLWNCINGPVLPPANVQTLGASGTSDQVSNQADHMKKNEKRCMRAQRGALPPVVYNYIRGCKIAKDIWIMLKEKYQGSEKTKINSIKQCLIELKEFRQKNAETIENYYDCLNELVYRCTRYGITRSPMEFNLIFIMGLHKEWRSVSMMIKNQQSFYTSSLNDLYNQLKTYENKVGEMLEESKQSLGGPLALVLKMNEVESIENEGSNDEGRWEEWFKKVGVKAAGEEKKKYDKYEKVDENMKELKAEKKLKGDSGVNCHYCNGANHFAADYMLRKKDEKKSKVKYEAYYAEKLEEVRTKAKGLSLVAKGEMDNDESGTYQIWSSGSDDEEMRHPTHGAMFASFEKNGNAEEEISRNCFVSKSTGNYPMTTKSASTEAQNLKTQLAETRRQDRLDKDVRLLLAQRNIYFDVISYDCEDTIAQFDKIPDDRFAYGIVKIDEFQYVDELVDIVNDSLTKTEQIKILKKTETSTLDSQNNYADVDDNSDNIKGKEILVDSIVKVDTDKPSTSQLFDFDDVEVRSSQTDDTDGDEEKVKPSCECKKEKNVSTETSPTRVVVEQVYSDSKEFNQIHNYKGAHYLETNTVVYPNFTCTDKTVFPNQVFVTARNVEQIKPEFNKMVENDNKRSTTKGFFENQNMEKEEKVFQKDGKTKSEVKLNSHKFKVMVGKFSCENNVSKRKARKVVFNEESNIIPKVNANEVLLKSKRYGDMFTLDINPIVGKPAMCLLSKASNDISWLWHRRLSHLNFCNINKLVTQDLVRACEQGKQHRKRHPIIIDSNIVEPLKSEVSQTMIDFIKKIEMSIKKSVRKIKSDNGSEFKNQKCFIMILKDNLSKFDAKADEGIFLGYSHNSVAYRIDRKFEHKPIIADSNNPVENENTIDFDYELIFGILDRAIDAEIHAADNQSPESSKNIDDSPHTSNSNSSESMPEVLEGELEGAVEGEYEVDDNISIAETENEEVYEDTPLDFDPAYPPMEKWTKSHPKEYIIGNPQEGVLTRAQIRAKNEVL
ncbi:uncharacterized protein LOC111890076 [Lactuca sativa]|uniref:uncharacterized protein LOC111890076 n=1 Tax=Lactuca sativa TaxID=4236 RepID=UPI0022AFD0F0|nr:uncharacterized protein LOC111890076 [Lactuca sativa]